MNDDNRNAPRRKRRNPSKEESGVYYESSGKRSGSPDGQRKRASQPVPKKGAPERQVQGGRNRNSRSGSQYIYFYIITLIVAVIVCVAVFFMAFRFVTKGKTVPEKTGGQSELSAQQKSKENENFVSTMDEISIVGVINGLNTKERKIEIYDIENLKTFTYNIGGATTLKNKHGEAMSISELKIGDIVDARVGEESEILSSLNISSMAWEYKQITNVKINTESSSVIVGNEAYKYTKETKVVYEGAPFEIGKIDPLNVVTLRGMKDQCWFVEVEKAVGTIEVINSENIKGGIIEIDTNNRILMEEDGKISEPIKVQEGRRRIVVKGSNIEPFTKEIDVVTGETVTLDLSEAVVTAGELTISLNVSDAKVTIDGKEIRAKDPQVLPYGKYILRAEREGYEPFEQEITLDSPKKEFTGTLIEAVKMKQISVSTTPNGANVYIDNNYMGISPITVSVEENARVLTVKKAGYSDMTIYMLEGENSYALTLHEDISLPENNTGGNVPVIPEDNETGNSNP